MNKWSLKNLYIKNTKILPSLVIATTLLLIISTYLIIKSPADYQQSVSVKIMYLHVPCAWISLLCYAMMTIAAFLIIVKNGDKFCGFYLKASAPIGAIFSLITLLTGALWGHVSWGTWWEWDARLTSMLLLFFIYIALSALSNAFYDTEKANYATALLTLLGSINLPVIKFSVEWWHSLHQPPSFFNKGLTAIDPSMLWPLLSSALAFTTLFLMLQIISIKLHITQYRLYDLQYKKIYRMRKRKLQKHLRKEKNI